MVYLLLTASIFSQSQINIQVKPGVSIPTSFSEDGSIFKTGFTTQLMGQLKFHQDSIFFGNAVFSYSNNPTKADNLSMNMLSLGVGAGVNFNLRNYSWLISSAL